ncbi:rRNA pseudouridine synthase [Pseudomonas matsuisoli]|uniref:Dual-specificity RNA pseudouridine synthase RluF n=1 Tax=Pseudomonas matsuisoli TaxID=1515666 RepID=A0A917PZ11_9PSED|nr:rRNA pseudouridine synthase [Pseudomonas matsuisoli]GGK00944.1 RNA-binding protein S4 [Pseudomonas matsuisoli]
MSEPIRLSKRLIELTGCSRREAELYIEGGWVTVDGAVVDEPQFKVDTHAVALLPGASATPLAPATLLLNMPAGSDDHPETLRALLSTATHWAEDPAETRVLKGHFVRLSPGLSLQKGAGGLAIFTQDWRTLRKITADGYRLEQEYVAEVSGQMHEDGLERLKRGHSWKGQPIPPCKVSWQNETRLRFALKNPALDAVQTMCASVGLKVESMKRLRVGGVSIGKVPEGQWRYAGATDRF